VINSDGDELMTGIVDLTGQRFGRLTVIRRGQNGSRGEVRWWCECSCGKSCVLVFGFSLRGGDTKSCTCLTRERFLSHGRSSSPEHKAWIALKQRCSNPKLSSYPYYGGRGIRVCERWMNSFENFLTDMGPRPSAEHSIDRLDVNGNYEPSNCIWSDPRQQARNKRNSLLVAHNGETLHINEWSERTGINPATLRKRLLTLSWTPKRAFETPAGPYRRGFSISYQGETLSLSAIARKEGVCNHSLYYHAITKGIPVEDALKILKGSAKAKPAK
jgi:hypothetical protein